MMNLTDITPPLELCKLIPDGEFSDTYAAYFWDANGENITLDKRDGDAIWKDIIIAPAPTVQEILEELHKCEEDVYVKWSETAYHEWLINAYTHNSRDFQAHDRNMTTAAMKVWLKLKGIEV